MLRFAASRSRGRVIAWSLLLATAAAIGLTRWIKASDHKDSALLAADHAADIADLYTFRSPANPDNVVLAMIVSVLAALPKVYRSAMAAAWSAASSALSLWSDALI